MIAIALLDDYDVEPLPAGHGLRSAPQHRAHAAPRLRDRGTYARYYGDAVEDVAAFMRGEPVRVIKR